MATNLKVLVSDVLELISDLRGESSTNTDANRIRAVSRANQDFARRKLWRFYRLDNQTQVGSAVNSYTVGSATYPMRYKGLTEVFVAPTGGSQMTLESQRYFIVDYNAYKSLYNQSNGSRMVYEWFDAANDLWKMYINPAPTAYETITYSYYWEPPELTLTSEYIICPNPRIIALLGLAEILDAEDEPESAREKRMDAEQLVSEVISLENAPAINQVYGVNPIESGSGGGGVGTY